MGVGEAMLGTGRDLDYVNWEVSRWCYLAALLTPRSYALNLGGFGATIRRHLFPSVARCYIIGLCEPISLLRLAHRRCVLRSGWCQECCQTPSATPLP